MTTKKKKHNNNKTKKSYRSPLSSIVKFFKDTFSQKNTETDDKIVQFEKDTLYYTGFEKEYNKKNIPYSKLSKDLIHSITEIDSKKIFTKPHDDFYTYVNELWETELKVEDKLKYIVQVDNFRLVQDKVYHELLDIVDDYTKKGDTDQAVQMKNLYHSIKKGTSAQSLKESVKEIIFKVDYMRQDKNNLWKFIGRLNQNDSTSYSVPLCWTLRPDNKQPNIFRSYINAPKLTLLDYNVYFDDGTDIKYKEKYRNAYFEFLSKLFYVALGHNNINVKDVYDVEVDIINSIGCDEGIVESDNLYNRVTTKQALKDYNFNWEEFSDALGFSTPPDFFITNNLNYLKCGTKLLIDNWTSDKWRTYWLYIIFRHVVRMSSEHSYIYYDFMGDFMTGQSGQIDRTILPIFMLSYAYNTFLTNSYIAKYQKEETVEYLKNMAFDLKEVFIKIITLNKWMQPKTKANALLKLKNLKLIVGSPKELTEDPDLSFDMNDAISNMAKIGEWRHNRFIELEGKEVVDFPTVDWSVIPPKLIGTQAYIVNASYTPSKNAIYVPLGYIQKPFIDLEERGIEYNLAHVGFTLSHEMSHALDDWGSQYDYKGVLNNWWTPKDKAMFKSIQKNVIAQYELFAKRDGIVFDASIGIGEDLADISGLNICTQYLAEFQQKNEDISYIRIQSFKIFYLYYAYQMRQKLSKKAIAAQLKTNPHPLDKYRTNVPLTRLDLFKKLYNVKKGNGMFWQTKHIW